MKLLKGVASLTEGSPLGKLREDRQPFLVSIPAFVLFCWNMSLTEAAGVFVLAANRGKSWH